MEEIVEKKTVEQKSDQLGTSNENRKISKNEIGDQNSGTNENLGLKTEKKQKTKKDPEENSSRNTKTSKAKGKKKTSRDNAGAMSSLKKNRPNFVQNSVKDSPGSKSKFAIHEKVLCKKKKSIYKAKVSYLKYSVKYNSYKYLVHYTGWTINYDEWVDETRLLKLNRQNLHEFEKIKAYRLADRQMRKKEQQNLIESPTSTQDQSKIALNENTKEILTTDWALICLEKKFVKLPPSITVSRMFNDFLNNEIENCTQSLNSRKQTEGNMENKFEKTNKDNSNEFLRQTTEEEIKVEFCQEMLIGLGKYFKEMLASELLYENETQQFERLLAIHGHDCDLTEIYGLVHLFRMFVKFGEKLKFYQDGAGIIVNQTMEFVRFLESSPEYAQSIEYITGEEEHQNLMSIFL